MSVLLAVLQCIIEINTFSEDALNWSKVIKTFELLQKIYFSDKRFFFFTSYSKKPEEFYSAIFYNNNVEMFFFLAENWWFLKDHVTGVMMLKIQLWSQE